MILRDIKMILVVLIAVPIWIFLHLREALCSSRGRIRLLLLSIIAILLLPLHSGSMPLWLFAVLVLVTGWCIPFVVFEKGITEKEGKQ